MRYTKSFTSMCSHASISSTCGMFSIWYLFSIYSIINISIIYSCDFISVRRYVVVSEKDYSNIFIYKLLQC